MTHRSSTRVLTVAKPSTPRVRPLPYRIASLLSNHRPTFALMRNLIRPLFHQLIVYLVSVLTIQKSAVPVRFTLANCHLPATSSSSLLCAQRPSAVHLALASFPLEMLALLEPPTVLTCVRQMLTTEFKPTDVISTRGVRWPSSTCRHHIADTSSSRTEDK